MRYLLKQDQEKFNLVQKWVIENWDKKTPDLTSKKQKFTIKYSTRDMEVEIIKSKLIGKDKTELDIIKSIANSKDEFIVYEPSITNEINNNEYKTYYGDVYSVNKDFLDKYAEIKYFEKLENLTSKYLNSLGYHDTRNFYEKNGAIYYGIRERNKYDAHLIGDIVSGTFVMSSKDYDNVLANLKKNIEM